MTTPRRILIPSLAFAALALASCGDEDEAAVDATEEVTEDASTSETPAETTETTAAQDGAEDGSTVTIEQSRYAPQTLEVAAGTSVTFENLDPYVHTVTSAEGSAVEFDSGEFGQDATFEQAFDEAGTYEYFCQIHPTMRAEVVVS